jgi:hypothetical protein
MRGPMNRDREEVVPQQTNSRRTLSFKSTIVMTVDEHGREPTIEDVKLALVRYGVRFSLPASADAPVVISLRDGA